MKLVKKLLYALPFVISLWAGAAFAKNNVSEIDIEVIVRDDASALVVQHWSGEFNSGTENYIPIATDDISVSDLRVWDEKGEYTLLSRWDVDADLKQKARKCGINETSSGVEVCFGISEYGSNTYNIEYVVGDFIKSYTDFDGTNFMFINPYMSTFPTNGHIKITLENGTDLTEENSGIWAFGYNGYIEFKDGAVEAATTEKLTDDASMIVMLRLDKGLISPGLSVDTSFDAVTDEAFRGSNYDRDYGDEGMRLLKIIGIIFMIILLTIIIVVVVFLIKRKKEIKRFYKEAEYFRDVPNGGKIEVSHYLAQTFDVASDESLIIGALMLSMINKGSLKPLIEESVGFFGKAKESVNLELVKKPESKAELSLYKLICASAGDDGILQEKELEKYAYKHPQKINNLIDKIKENGEDEFIASGGFTSGAGNCIKDLSDKGKAELSEIMGLKKFLEDFTLIAERGITETVIWKDYLIYATLFGISDRVIAQLKKVYPEIIPEIETYNRNVVIASSYYHSMYTSSQRAIQAQRSSGMGGSASFGGGGGFSGGGSGGGSR